jgi:hypothetical protein
VIVVACVAVAPVPWSLSVAVTCTV